MPGWYEEHGYRQNAFGTWRKPLPPDEIIGYECNDEEIDFHMFRCSYHENAEDWQSENCRPVTIRDTQTQQYDCDRMGCELNYLREPMLETQ